MPHRRSQGISSDLFAALLRELDASKDTEMHHFMALRHGKVICECNFAPYPKGMWHITHSMCKSITGMAIGMLIEEEKLNSMKIFMTFFRSYKCLFKDFPPCDHSRESADHDKRRNF